MRARTSVTVSSLVAALSVLTSSCSRDEPPLVEAVPPRPPPQELEQVTPMPEPRPSQGVINQVRAGASFDGPSQRSTSLAEAVPQNPRRLVFECSDGATFAVRSLGSRLELFPPGMPANGFLVLGQVATAAGMHYRAGDTDFRSEGDRATLEIGRERYVDCVANPAAAVWQELERPDTATR